MNMRAIGAHLFSMWIVFCGDVGKAQAPNILLNEQERQELEAYRTHVPELIKSLDEARKKSVAEPPEIAAYRKYLVQYYEQSSQLREVRIRMFAWQSLASTWVLVLVVVLTLGGLGLAAYQLFIAARLGQKMESIGFEASVQKVQLTTSTVGIVILVISGVYLLLFLKGVYPVRPSPPAPTITNQ